MSTEVFDVAIVGHGPAGAMLANLLGQAGLSVLVIEREAGIYPLPRAIHFDGEVMRVFQNAGLRRAVEAISRPGLSGMHFVNAQGQTLLIRGGTTFEGPHGCASNYYFHQPELEQVLREGAQRFDTVQVLLGHEVSAIEEHGDHAALTVTRREDGQTRHHRARYVVGCDGARSLVRRLLQSPMRDLGLEQPWLVFDVLLGDNAPELPPHTVQYCDPSRPMTYCNVTGRRRRWEIMLMPGDDREDLVRPERLWQLVSPWIRPDQASIERAVIYTFHSVIAEGWRRGRLMLAGDAAHQTPPFLGQGMCAAIRDAANLAWKLHAVLRRGADDRLLDSYEAERSPHVHAFIDLAVRLGNIIQTTDPQAARERDQRFLQGSPEIFEFPAPRLGPGVWRGQSPEIGRPFAQPRLGDGRLLDEHLGQRFALIAHPTLLAQAGHALRERWDAADLAVLPAQAPALADWLDTHGVRAIMLRPDRYVMGTATSPEELETLTSMVPMVEPQPHDS
jgi:3-(3-hydroxy-phenyl)propionate hydroxylase